MGRVSLKDIAGELGISEQTVSRALRGERYVRPELKRQIQELADKLGYRPDPRLNALLAHLRQGKQAARGETMALILPDSSEKTARKYHFTRGIVEGVEARIERFGFGLEIHALEDYPSREMLERVLRARGIELLIIAPMIKGNRRSLSLHWERYAAVLIGPGIWRPRLNRVLPNYYLNLLQILRHVKKLGYRRPALVIKESVLVRAASSVEASFRQNAGLIGLKNPRNFVYREPVEDHPDGYRDWLIKMEIDVVLSDQCDDRLLRRIGFSIPQDLGFIGIGGDLPPEISGIDVRTDLLGAHAVDLLAGHYYRNERGIPDIPKILMHEGEWQPGATTKVQPSKKWRSLTPSPSVKYVASGDGAK